MPQPRPTAVAPETERVLSQLSDLGLSSRQESELPELIRKIFRERTVEHPDGRQLKLVAEQDILNSSALHQLVRAIRPQQVVEIGMAFGVSTLSVLTALQSNQQGHLISIDPYIGWPTGAVVARHQVARAGFTDRHRHIQDLSQYAMPRLIGEGLRPDLVYIDGHHGVEYVLVDTFFADKLLPVGGVMGFNDVGWQSVSQVIQFLLKYRDYREVSVGLPLTFRGRNLLYSLARRFQGRSNYDRYFVKNSDWEYDGYIGF